MLTGGLLAALSAVLLDALRDDLAQERILAATAQVREEVLALVRPVAQQLLILRDGLDVAGPGDEQPLNHRLIPILAHIPQIAGARDADTDGAEYFLRREGDGWLSRARDPAAPGVLHFTLWDAQAVAKHCEARASDRDPRTRPWFQQAIGAPGRVTWTAPYVFHSLGVPGITAAIAWTAGPPWTEPWRSDPAASPGAAGALPAAPDRVTALDVTLENLIRALDELDLGAEGRAFLVGGDGGVFAPPDPGTAPNALPAPVGAWSHIEVDPPIESFFSAAGRLGGSIPFEAVSAWQAAGRPAKGTLRFASASTTWWAGFRPLTDDLDAAWIGVALPAPQALGELGGRWYLIGVAALAVLGLGIGLALLVVRKYSRRLRELPKLSIDPAHPEADLRELIAGGEGAHLEFKSTMRLNLRTRANGKEIELAWLKGVAAFLNTEGGIVLLGVGDDGQVLGLAEDRFENEDRCRLHFKNLLSQHLGPEYARFVRFDIHDLDGLRIGAVECERAEAPAFLRYDGKGEKAEAFLIRSGPSNLELSVSRAMRYIRGRF